MPQVSIVIPLFNRAILLPETLHSILAQSYSDWEAILVDDHSSDNSLAIAQSFAATDSRIRAFSRCGSAKGANVCRNEGLALAKGEYVIFLDSDDLLVEDCLERRVSDIEARPDCDFGVYIAELFAETPGDTQRLWNIYTDQNDLDRFLALDGVWDITGPIWRRRTLQRIGTFDETLASYHDWEFHVRALILDLKYYKQPVRDHFYRYNRGNKAAISGNSQVSPEHLNSHLLMFKKVHQLLVQQNRMTSYRSARTAALFWWLSRLWIVSHKDLENAEVAWGTARELRLISTPRYIMGRLFQGLHCAGGPRFIRAAVERTWPRHFRSFGSEFRNKGSLDWLHTAKANGILAQPQRS